MKHKTQCERVIEHMISHGYITQLQATYALGVLNLSARISDIEKLGYKIDRKNVRCKNRFGEKVTAMEYRIGD